MPSTPQKARFSAKDARCHPAATAAKTCSRFPAQLMSRCACFSCSRVCNTPAGSLLGSSFTRSSSAGMASLRICTTRGPAEAEEAASTNALKISQWMIWARARRLPVVSGPPLRSASSPPILADSRTIEDTLNDGSARPGRQFHTGRKNCSTVFVAQGRCSKCVVYNKFDMYQMHVKRERAWILEWQDRTLCIRACVYPEPSPKAQAHSAHNTSLHVRADDRGLTSTEAKRTAGRLRKL